MPAAQGPRTANEALAALRRSEHFGRLEPLASGRWSSLWPPPRPCTALPSARLVRGRTQCSHSKDQAASCTCHHPAALWAWRSAGSLCSWLWCRDADTCCCMSVAQIGGFHCQSFVDVGLSLSFKVLWNLRFVLRGTHSLPTPHAYPVSRSAASAIRGSVETPETNGAIVLDRTANICSMAIVRNTRFVPCRATRRGRAWLFWQSRRGQKIISRRSLRLALRMP